MAESDSLQTFHWEPQPQAATLIDEILEDVVVHCPSLERFRAQLHQSTGTRLVDWVESVTLPASEGFEQRLLHTGFTNSDADRSIWFHAGGLFPAVETHRGSLRRVAVRVESVPDFLVAHALDVRTPIQGPLLGQLRQAKVAGGAAAGSTAPWPPAQSPPNTPNNSASTAPSVPTWRSSNAIRATRDSTRKGSIRSFKAPTRAGRRDDRAGGEGCHAGGRRGKMRKVRFEQQAQRV